MVKSLLEIDLEKVMLSTANDENIWSQVTKSEIITQMIFSVWYKIING